VHWPSSNAADTARLAARNARDVVRKIRYLRQHYHFAMGRMAAYLGRFHQIARAPGRLVVRCLACESGTLGRAFGRAFSTGAGFL
jgi:hypothetical protein